ncbi:MAG: 16S rRNA (cytosine(1402)-N(4))-methyltransferase [Planctomycetota bacterium]|nr:MAG: 16S rRNA (cytosine(1402)-N(4))-methyltransferase [Planctomycetota bacterium]
MSYLWGFSQSGLEEVMRENGEARMARFLASRIYRALREERITSAADLSSLIEKLLPRRGRLHPATRLFQALRIAVNRELQHLETLLRRLPSLLAPGARFVAISYHSLEDRLIKRWLRRYGAEGVLKILTKKVVRASADEVAANRRARSAKLRAAEAL